jgi:hypothetical protein
MPPDPDASARELDSGGSKPTPENAKIALISGLVAIVVALISTFGTLAAKKGELQEASKSATSASEKATSASEKAASVSEKASETLGQLEQAHQALATGLYQTVYSENRQFVRSAETIPWDDTIPQQGEGAKVVSVSITPKSKSGCLVVTAIVHAVEETNSADHIILALFRDSEPDAVSTAVTSNTGPFDQYGVTTSTPFHTVLPVSGSAPIRLTLRAGLNSGVININGANGGRRLGGSLISSITVSEVAPCTNQKE